MFQGPGSKSGDKRLARRVGEQLTTSGQIIDTIALGTASELVAYDQSPANTVEFAFVGPTKPSTLDCSNNFYLPARGWNAAGDSYMLFQSAGSIQYAIGGLAYGLATTPEFYIGTGADSNFYLMHNYTARWGIHAGALFPAADATYDIGSTSNRVKNLYLTSGGTISFATGDVQIIGFSGQLSINAPSAIVNSVGITTGAVYPVTNDGVSLGTSANKFSDLYLAAGALITFSTDPVNITAGTSALTVNASSFATVGNQFTVTAATADIGSVRFTTNAIRPATNDGVALGSSALKFSDLYLASGAVLQFSTEATSITHGASQLTIAASTLIFNSTLLTINSVNTIIGGLTISTANIFPTSQGGMALGSTSNQYTRACLSSVGSVVFGADTALSIEAGAGSQLSLKASTVVMGGLTITTASIAPSTDGGMTLGTSSNKFSAIHMTSGNIFFTTDNSNQRINAATSQLTITATTVAVTGRFNVSGSCAIVGDTTIGGTLVLTTGQISFPAAAVLSAGANTLDDYEEGLFTPTWTPNTTGTYTIGYGISTSGNYTKIGNRVSLSCLIAVTTHTSGTGTGQMGVSGLPFVGTTHERSPGRVQAASSGYRGFELCGMATAQSVARAQFKVATTGATSNLNLADITTGSETFLFSISYASSS